jgi:hypothetical protein
VPNKNIVLQERDTSLIRVLAEEFRILSREQIGELFPMGSAARLNFRLKQLRDAGYLSSRSLAALGAAVKYGYYLGPRAIELFPDSTEQKVVSSLRTQAAQLAESGLAHRFLVDSIHIRFLTASRHYPNYKLLTWIDQYSPAWEGLREYGVPVQADGYGEYLMLMHFDSLFTLFLEVDRGTERGQTLQDKIARYIQFAESGNYEQKFAAKNFRVLFITTSPRRLQGLLKMMGNSEIFWVTTWDRFKSAKLFDHYWSRPNRQGFDSLASHP